MLRVVCLLAVLLLGTLTVMADIPPPPPEAGFKRVPCEHVVKLGGEIPGYKFYTFEQFGLNGDITVKELALTQDKSVAVPAADSPSVWMGVLAVPTKIVEQEKTAANLSKLLARDGQAKRPAGVVIHTTRGTQRDLKTNDPRSKVENVITISADDKAGVKFTAAEAAAVPGKNTSSETTTPPSGTMLAGVAMSLALVTSGLWWVRRKSTIL